MTTSRAADPGEPGRDSYDCVIVGSGLGGLSAAAFLAKSGKSVLVVERLDGPGGYVHSFQRGSYLFDPAVHAVGQGREAYMLDVWLRALGVRDRVDLIQLDPSTRPSSPTSNSRFHSGSTNSSRRISCTSPARRTGCASSSTSASR